MASHDAQPNFLMSPSKMRLNHDIGGFIGYLSLAITSLAVLVKFPSFIKYRLRPNSRPPSFKINGYLLSRTEGRTNPRGSSNSNALEGPPDSNQLANGTASSSSPLLGVKLRLAKVFSWNLPGMGAFGANLNLGTLLFMVVYAALLVILGLYENTYHGLNIPKYRRFGFMAVAQFPLTFLLAMKNSPLATLIGVGYEKLNFIHRFIGRMIFVCALVHGSLQLRLQTELTGVIRFQNASLAGLIALCALALLNLMGIKFLRNSFYQTFVVAHVLGYVSVIVALWIHTKSTRPFIGASIACIVIDNSMKMLKSRVKYATFTAMPAGLTRIEVQGINDGWRAGQHIFIRVLKGRHIFEKHPFTIANAPHSSTPYGSTGHLLLVVKAAGDFTKRIHHLAGQPRDEVLLSSGEKSASSLKDSSDLECVSGTPFGEPNTFLPSDVCHRVLVDGPYGNSFADMTRYRTVILCAGGSGFTYCMASLEDIVGEAATSGKSLTKHVFLVWSLREPEMIKCFIREIEETIRVGKDCGIDIAIKIFITKGGSQTNAKPTLTKRYVEFHFSRPNMAHIIEDVINAKAMITGGGLGVGACGPLGLVDSVTQGVHSLNPDRVQQFGGLKLHTEKFGW